MKKILSLLMVVAMVLSMVPAVFAAEASFTDVEAGKYYVNPIDWAVDNEITNGTGDGTTFSPKDGCTRKQVVTFLWRAAGQPEASVENPFTDIPEGKYYTEAVLWAYENAITLGKTATTFEPDATCTRAQIVTFLYRYMGEPEVTSSEIAFPDVAAGKYYTNAVLWAAANGITQGNKEGNFQPDKTCTRGDIVTFLFRNEMNIPVEIASAAALSEIKLYPETTRTYLVNGRLATNVLTIAAVEGLSITVDGVELEAQNGVFTAILEGAPNSVVVITYTGKEIATAEASIAPKGGENAPIVINAAGELSSIDVAAGGEVYYAINGRLSGQYITIAAAEGVTVTVGGKEVKAENGKFVALLDGAPTTAVVVKNAGKEDVSLVAEINYAEGTEGNPMVINALGDYGIDVAAEGELWIAVSGKLNGNLLVMEAIEGVTVTINGEKAVAAAGLYSIELKGTGANNSLVITNTTKAAVESTLTVVGKVGTEGNPYTIDSMGDHGIDIAAEGETWIAVNSKLNGNLLVMNVIEGVTLTVNGEEIETEGEQYEVALDATGANNVVVINNETEEKIETTLTVIGKLGSESNPYVINVVEDMTGVEAAAGTSAYYAISSNLNGMILTITEVEGMTVSFNGAELTAEDGLFVAELNGAPVNKLVVTAGDEDVATPAIIEYPLGSESNPYIVNEASDLLGIKVEAGETVYYMISSLINGKDLYVDKVEGVTVTLNGTIMTEVDAVYEMYAACLDGTPVNKLVVTNTTTEYEELSAFIMDAPGTEGNPIMIVPAMTPGGELFSFDIPAGETVYFIGRVSGKIITIEQAGSLKVTIGEDEYYAEKVGENAGKIVIEMPAFEGMGMPPATVIAITNRDEENAYEDGAMFFTEPKPETVLNWGSNTASVPYRGEVVYEWTATAMGLVTVTITETEATNWAFLLDKAENGYPVGINEWHSYSAGDDVVKTDSLEVQAGDTIQIIITTSDWAAADIDFTAEFIEAT